MCFVRKVMLYAASAAFPALVSVNFGIDLKYYWDMSLTTQEKVCKDAVQANPDIVKQLQSIAERYVKQIQSELAALAKSHSCLDGVGQAKIEVPAGNETGKVMCGLEFVKNTHPVQMPSGTYQRPDKEGCVLCVGAYNIIAKPDWYRRSGESARLLAHEIEMRASYGLILSEKHNDLDKTVRALIDQRFKEMCDEMKKLQTAEDKNAGDGS